MLRTSPYSTKSRLLTAAVFLLVSVAAQATAPERRVEGHAIISDRDPRLRIELPASTQYVGADRWVLYDLADCELHVFVEADARKNVQRMYWVQFEQYVPSRPELHHTYNSPRHAVIGGLDFYVDTWVRARGEETRAGSDREHIEALIRAKGYRVPAGMADVRLVHLLDDAKRQELMIIYGEDLAPTRFSVADLQEKGKHREQWPDIEGGLIERAKERIRLNEIK